MAYPTSDYKKYYLPLYLLWIIIGPSLILLSNYPYDKSILEVFITNQDVDLMYRLTSFYLIFGLVWPIMIVIYPAFYDSLLIKFGHQSIIEALGDSSFLLPFILWVVAIVGPVVGLGISLYLHKKAVMERSDEDVTWKKFFIDFI